MTAFHGGAGKKGMALIMAIFSLLILGILAGGFMTSSVTEYKMSFNEQESMSSGQLSEAGLAYGYQWLQNQDPAPCQSGGAIDLGSISVASCGTTNPLIYADAANDCSEGGFDCSDIGGDDRTWKYTIHADGTTAHGTQGAAEIDVSVGYDNSACYAMFFDRCQAYFADYDVVKGPVHCNEKMALYNKHPDPPWTGCRFWGPVSWSHDSFKAGGTSACGSGTEAECYATFYDGYETGVDKIDYPPDFGNVVDGIDPSYVWTKNTRILLHADGTMTVWNHAITDSMLMPMPIPGVCHVKFTAGEGDADVSGTLNGQLTIVADRNIIIRDDILLAADPRFNPNSDDMLGLVAAFKRDGDIIIPDVNPLGVDGDRIIQAYLIALRSDGKVKVIDWSTRAREGILYTYGGWVVATITATETQGYLHGYGTDTEHDKRGCRCPPPGFPPLKDHNRPITKVSKVDATWREVY